MANQRIRQALDYVRRAQAFLLRDMWSYDTTGKPRIFTWAVHLLKISFLVYKNLTEKRFFLRAHALTYWTLISIVPLLAVLAVALKGLGQTDLADERFWPHVERVLIPVAPAGRMMLDTVATEEDTGAVGALAAEQKGPKQSKPETEDRDQGGSGTNVARILSAEKAGEDARYLVARIRSFVENINTKAIGVAGFTVALFTVISLLTKVEQGFNDIWGIKRKRTFVTRLVVYWGVVTLPALVILISSAYNVMTKGEKLLDQVHDVPVLGAMIRFLLPPWRRLVRLGGKSRDKDACSCVEA